MWRLKCSQVHLAYSVLPMAMMIMACGKTNGARNLGPKYRLLNDVSPAQWATLASKKIYFGHKSVGQNIIEGLEDVMRVRPEVELNIRETTDPGDFAGPVFAHSPLGRNRAPLTKIAGFQELMESGLGNVVDIAFFKLCFVDIDHTTDIETLFAKYRETIQRLREEFPKLQILTWTVPLMSRPLGIKGRAKKLLGRLPWEKEDNIKRNLYNEMLRKSFGDSLFDLADCEATGPEGDKSYFVDDGKRYDLLKKAYTDDSGHLNEIGRQVIAIGLLKRLADLR